MSNRDANGDSDGADAQLTPIHVTAVLVASERAMSNDWTHSDSSRRTTRIVERRPVWLRDVLARGRLRRHVCPDRRVIVEP